MQTPDGRMVPMDDEDAAKKLAQLREEATGKPHPVFQLNEELEIRGGKFRVHAIRRNRIILKPVKY